VPVFELTPTGKFPPAYDAGVRFSVRSHDPSVGAAWIAARMRHKWLYARWQSRPRRGDEAQFIIAVQRAIGTLEPSGSAHSRYDEHPQKCDRREDRDIKPGPMKDIHMHIFRALQQCERPDR